MPETSRRRFLATAGIGAPALLGQAKDRPNVLFILADEWRAQATGYSGDTNADTPVLDGLARQSVQFANAVSGTPVCCPYRASLLTGQYPLTHGLFINDVELKPNGPTWGETFANAGYRTGFIGKWHVYGSPDGNYGRRLAYVPPEKRLGFEYWKACECSHDYNHSLYYEGSDPTPRSWPGYDAIAQSADACRFIERQARARTPYSLILSLGPPHFPYPTAPPKYRAMYEHREIALRPNVPAEHRAEATETLRGYYAHIAALDDCVARLLSTLGRTGTADNTIVVFTSDHGDMMRSQGLTTKLYPWEESVRVPFLLRYPRKLGSRGRSLSAASNAPDILPTLLHLCGLKVPDSVEGVDVLGPDAPNAALLSLPAPITEARKFGFAEYRGLRTAQHTYVRSIRGPWLLYDNRADPFQMHNLCGRPEARDIQSRLDSELSAALKARKDEFLPASEYVKRAGVGHYREINVPVGQFKSPWGDWASTMSG